MGIITISIPTNTMLSITISINNTSNAILIIRNLKEVAIVGVRFGTTHLPETSTTLEPQPISKTNKHFASTKRTFLISDNSFALTLLHSYTLTPPNSGQPYPPRGQHQKPNQTSATKTKETKPRQLQKPKKTYGKPKKQKNQTKTGAKTKKTKGKPKKPKKTNQDRCKNQKNQRKNQKKQKNQKNQRIDSKPKD